MVDLQPGAKQQKPEKHTPENLTDWVLNEIEEREKRGENPSPPEQCNCEIMDKLLSACKLAQSAMRQSERGGTGKWKAALSALRDAIREAKP